MPGDYEATEELTSQLKITRSCTIKNHEVLVKIQNHLFKYHTVICNVSGFPREGQNYQYIIVSS